MRNDNDKNREQFLETKSVSYDPYLGRLLWTEMGFVHGCSVR
jgi:hypothetical protein